jgi:hypothetical protein
MPSKSGFDKNPQNINRNGRPKKDQTMTQILMGELDDIDVSTPQGKIKAKQAISRKLIEVAMNGDVTALKYIYDRIDGSPRTKLEAELTDKRPITFPGGLEIEAKPETD